MCGIAGMIHKYKTLEEQNSIARKIIGKIKHRGPDEDGIYCDKGAMLLHARLSVIDIENGKQPMCQKRHNQEYALVYNGELYNTDEIRKELYDKGWSFDGHSDTEVVLKSYIQWGENCVDKFNGIFAFAVWESGAKRLFVARDRMGVKPFFYTIKDGAFYFSSEIKGLLCFDEIEAQADSQSIAEIMLIGPARTAGYGVFKGVKELQMGECGCFENGKLNIKKYWDVKAAEHTDNFEQTVEKVRYLVTDAIKRQTISDVPICCFLSGGLDSSAICSIANSNIHNLNTFSVEYRDNEKYFKKSKFQPNSDDEYINEMSEYLGTTHHHIVIDTPQLGEALYDAVDARDLPGMADIDSSLLLFCKEVKKFSTVALSGECADEIFGGYPWYRDKDIRMINGFPWSQSTAYRASLVKDDILQDINPSQYVYERYRQTTQKVGETTCSPLEKRMKEMMRLNLEWFMQTLLDRKDRCSMNCGLEVRVPFCDYRIVEYLYNVPWEYKDYNGREKGLLRYALEGYLPEHVLWRKKSPYPKTHNPSYKKWCADRLREITENANSPLLDIVKKSEIEKLINGEVEQIHWYGQLMSNPQIMAYLIQTNYWLEKYRVKLV